MPDETPLPTHISPDELAFLQAALAGVQKAQEHVAFVAHHLFAKYKLRPGLDQIAPDGTIMVQQPSQPAEPVADNPSPEPVGNNQVAH